MGDLSRDDPDFESGRPTGLRYIPPNRCRSTQNRIRCLFFHDFNNRSNAKASNLVSNDLA